jgi:RNA polymerase-binding protein DksA
MDARTLATLKKSLVEERERLAADLADLEQSGHEALSEMSGENNYRDHMADQGTATFSKELDMSLEENVRDLMRQVDSALERIDSGTYGTCSTCGQTISAERLQAVPAADKCITCKSAEENL